MPFDPIPLTEIEHPGQLDKHKIAHDKMWGYFPEGLGIALRRFWKKYKKPLIVTENGICTDDPKVRIQAIKDYLHVCHQVLKSDIPIQGYIFWSTWDNFEWHLGPTYRFGLVEVNPETKDRRMTEAGRFYHTITQTGTVNL
ncbi:MAG: family 1 glycosylhydrolase [Cyclobacteriaceae bacterium]|nr:family 1 glycosylhydrolase [Cyclobacteriaceae bacterium]